MKNGFSMVELLITLVVVSLLMIIIMEVFIFINKNIMQTYSNMRAFTEIKVGTMATWSRFGPEDIAKLDENLETSPDASIVYRMKNEGISHSIISNIESAVDFRNITIPGQKKKIVGVLPKKPWR